MISNQQETAGPPADKHAGRIHALPGGRPVKIVIFAIGTEGDIRPALALGRGLAAAGHHVAIATGKEQAKAVSRLGLAIAPLSADMKALVLRQKPVFAKGYGVAVCRMMTAETLRLIRTLPAEAMDASHDADLVLGCGSAILLAGVVAEKRRIPFVRVQWIPFMPSTALVHPLWPAQRFPLPGPLNAAFGHLLRLAIWQTLGRAINRERRRLGLADYPAGGPWSLAQGYAGPTLHGFSSQVVARPADWPDWIAMPGFFTLPQAEHYRPSAALLRFLSAGPKPIYIGFGSMVGDPGRLARGVHEAVLMSGQRAIIASGWTGLGESFPPCDAIFVLKSAPHDWLFPRVALAVHHCGAGTSAAALHAGIPTVPVTFGFDQPFWAERLRQLKLATRPLNRRNLTAARLAAAIAAASAPDIVARAARFGERFRREDGVGAAIEQLQAWGLLARAQPARDEAGPIARGVAR